MTQTNRCTWRLFSAWVARLLVLACLQTGFRAAGAAPDETPQSPGPSKAPVLSGCEYDYSPFCLIKADRQADGFAVELLRAALKAMGRDVTFKAAPWAEIKQDLAEGRLQALPMVARTAEREEMFDFTFPYLTMHGTIVVRDDNTEIHGPADLKGKRVAVLQEDIAHEYLRQAKLGAVIVPLPSFAVALRELAAGKHEAVVIQKLLALQLMKEGGWKNLKTVGPPLAGYTQAFCLAVRKGDKELLSVLNEGLSIVLADGTFRRLHAKWFSPLEALNRTSSRIVVGGDRDYPPYEFLDRNGQPAGYNVDLTRAIARRMGLSVDIQLRHWAEVHKGLDQGEIDLVHGMFYSVERDQSFDFSPPHALIQHVIVARAGSPPLTDLQALAGKSILVMTGDILQDLAVKHGLEKQLVPVATQEEALRLLAAGQHDSALVAKVPALFWIQKHGWRNLVVPTQPVLSAEYCYGMPEGKEELLAVFAEGLAAIKKTGEYRAIQTKWLGPYEDSQIGFWTIARYALLGALPLSALLAGSLLWSRSLKAQVLRRTQELAAETECSRQAAEALGVSEARLRMAKNAAKLGIYDYDVASGSIQGDERVRVLWGFSPEESITYEGFVSRLHPDDRETARAMIQQMLSSANSGEYQAEYRVLKPQDGLVQWIEMTGQVSQEPNGAKRLVGTVQDITQRKAFQAELERLVQERTAKLQEAMGDLEHFSYSITHDMRAPLRAMQGFAGIMLEELCHQCPKSENRDWLQRITSSARRMDLLITDALQYSQTVRQELPGVPVDPGALLRSILQSYPNLQPPKAQIRIVGELPLVLGNEAGLTQCFANLLNNAVKFVEPGKLPEVRVWAEPVEGFVRLWFEDNGIGIPHHAQGRLFQMFQRASKAYEGTGIGLALVKKVAERLGGRVGVVSAPGQGSRFWLDLQPAQ